MLRLSTPQRFRGLTLVLLALLIVSASAQSQLPAQDPKPRDDDPPLKLEATLVQVPVTVTNRRGVYVTDLTAKDFVVYEDGVRQNIEFFKTFEEPFSVALLVDSSGSTATQLEQIRDAVNAFLDTLRERDRALLIEFNDSVRTLCELTNDKEVLRRAVAEIKSGEFTQVYEAVYTAVWEKFDGVDGRKAAIVFSDGIDTASSEIKEEDTLDAIVEMEDVLIYPIRYSTRRDVLRKSAIKQAQARNASLTQAMANPESFLTTDDLHHLDRLYRRADSYLNQLAELSGGVVEYAESLDDLKGAFERIANELRQQYLLAYYPLNDDKKRVKRRINVEVPRGGFRVRARPAYTISQ